MQSLSGGQTSPITFQIKYNFHNAYSVSTRQQTLYPCPFHHCNFTKMGCVIAHLSASSLDGEFVHGRAALCVPGFRAFFLT